MDARAVPANVDTKFKEVRQLAKLQHTIQVGAIQVEALEIWEFRQLFRPTDVALRLDRQARHLLEALDLGKGVSQVQRQYGCNLVRGPGASPANLQFLQLLALWREPGDLGIDHFQSL